MGKVVLLNSLISSLFVYKMTVLPSMPKKCVENIEKIVHEFLWENSGNKISLRILKGRKDMGGLRLFDIKAKEKSLKFMWIQA